MAVFLILLLPLTLALSGCDSSSPADILIASKPSDAVILMDDVEIGETPMQVTVIEEMQIEIRKPGFVSYKATLSPKDAPNLLVKLTPATENPEQAASKNASPPNTAAKPATQSSPVTIARLKQWYKAGRISKADYKQRVHQLKTKRDMELRALKERYRRGEINKSQYSQLVRRIEYKYEG